MNNVTYEFGERYNAATELILITDKGEKQRLLLLSLMKFSLIVFIKAQDVVVLMESRKFSYSPQST